MPVPEYVARLREHVGHDPLWLPGVTAVVLRGGDADGNGAEVLLGRRTDSGQWAPVSGIVDPGEHPADCAVREVLEETGVRAEVESLAWVGVSPTIDYPNGDVAQYLVLVFRCRHLAGEPRVADDESTAVGWFPLAELPPMSPWSRRQILSAKRHRGATSLER